MTELSKQYEDDMKTLEKYNKWEPPVIVGGSEKEIKEIKELDGEIKKLKSQMNTMSAELKRKFASATQFSQAEEGAKFNPIVLLKKPGLPKDQRKALDELPIVAKKYREEYIKMSDEFRALCEKLESKIQLYGNQLSKIESSYSENKTKSYVDKKEGINTQTIYKKILPDKDAQDVIKSDLKEKQQEREASPKKSVTIQVKEEEQSKLKSSPPPSPPLERHPSSKTNKLRR